MSVKYTPLKIRRSFMALLGSTWRILIVSVASCTFLQAPVAFGAGMEQMISREQKEMGGTGVQLGVGQDGKVYVINPGFLLRYNQDGSGKVGLRVSYAAMNVAANANGIIAVSASHMDHSVWLYSPHLEDQGRCADFLGSDLIGWMSPSDVQVGASGDFYAPDPHRYRIVRVAPDGKKVAEFSLKATGEDYKGCVVRLRVCQSVSPYIEICTGQLGEVFLPALSTVSANAKGGPAVQTSLG